MFSYGLDEVVQLARNRGLEVDRMQLFGGKRFLQFSIAGEGNITAELCRAFNREGLDSLEDDVFAVF